VRSLPGVLAQQGLLSTAEEATELTEVRLLHWQGFGTSLFHLKSHVNGAAIEQTC
jgi:hypothetical protein